MKEIIVVGASEPGYEIVDIIRENPDYKFIGFFDEFKKGEHIFNYIDPIFDNQEKTYFFAVAVGDVNVRERLFKKMLDGGLEPINLISRRSYVSPKATLGKGVVVYPNCSISYNARIGNNVLVNFNTSISHGAVVGDNTNVCPGVNIAGNVSIGKNGYIGIGSTIIEKRKICENVMVGANSLVIRDITEPGVYVGSPINRKLKGVE